jgi:Niemann-Pick C1 protein
LATNLKPGQSLYAYSLPYIFYDQYSYIKAVAIQNVLLALATIFLTVTIIQDAVCALIVVVVVFIISFNLIGLVWLLNVLIGGFAI